SSFNRSPSLKLRRGARVDDLALTRIITVLASDRNRAGDAVDVNFRMVQKIDLRFGMNRARVRHDILEPEPAAVTTMKRWNGCPWQADAIIAIEKLDIDLIAELLVSRNHNGRTPGDCSTHKSPADHPRHVAVTAASDDGCLFRCSTAHTCEVELAAACW